MKQEHQKLSLKSALSAARMRSAPEAPLHATPGVFCALPACRFHQSPTTYPRPGARWYLHPHCSLWLH